jgi:DNA polymerase-1
MRHHTFEQSDTYPIALLMKPAAFVKGELISNYVAPLNNLGVSSYNIVAFTLAYDENGKAPAKLIKEYLGQLLEALQSIGTKYLYVTDGAYFKTLAGQSKAEPHHGYVLPCKIKGYEHMQVVLGLNYQTLIYNPELQSKLNMGLNALAKSFQGCYLPIGSNIIHSAQYPEGPEAIAEALKSLHQYPSLTCDIEAFSLDFWDSGIGTIAFAWDQHNGLAFACDYRPIDPGQKLGYGFKEANKKVRALLREFFETYQGELTFHHAGYDLKPIIYNLWMKGLLDRVGLLDGLHIMTRKLHDTKIIAYLATNSTAGNELGLKTLAHAFAGNWAKEDIKDIRRIPLKELLEYNLVDALSTHYVRNKYEPIMVQDQQQQLYHTLMMPSQKLITQMELVGMPMSRKRIQEVKQELQDIQQLHLDTIQNSSVIAVMNLLVQTKAMNDANAKLKVKQHPLEKFADKRFNPNSGPQLQVLLYEQMGLPVIDYTDTKQPATGAETIEKLINHTSEPAYKSLLAALIEYGKVTKILSTFIPAFEGSVSKDDSDTVWLHGSFNLGGTVSGRLSSSDPNLQNIPSGSKYGKLIKSCFCAPEGYLFCGADFNSLEDYISALTTKDPNKLDVYIKGFDGHCLRAAYYFRDQLPHIDLTDPKSVNTIKDAHPELRQDSKAPTFLLTYGGTYHGMMSNLGWPEDKSKAIEANYHHLYQVSDQYVQKRLEQASKDGYVEVAFGLRVRTPLLKQVIFKGYKMPYEAAAEGRTAGNALGQSYGLLNNRAAVDFWQKVWASEYRYDILPSALIHDAIYSVMKDGLPTVTFANTELIKSMRWQELPEIQHPTVKLGAAIDVFWPTWANAITLPNEATPDQILEVCAKGKQKYLDKHRA